MEAVEERVDDLITRDEQLVEQLPRATGQREDRYMTLLVPDHPAATTAGERTVVTATPSLVTRSEATEPSRGDLESRVAALERTVELLVTELGLGRHTIDGTDEGSGDLQSSSNAPREPMADS